MDKNILREKMRKLSKELREFITERAEIRGKVNDMTNVEDLQDTLRLQRLNTMINRHRVEINPYRNAIFRHACNRPFGQNANNPYCLIFD